MSFFDKEDWSNWIAKVKWQLISFKFLAFWVFTLLIIFFWYSIERLHNHVVYTAKDLFTGGYIKQADVATIITHSQTVLYDVALSHILLFLGAILASVIAIKGVSYYTDGQKTKAVIDKIGPTEGETAEDLKQFLPKKGA